MSGTPGAYNIGFYQGQTLTLIFVWSAGTCCGSGTVGATTAPVDITGYTATMQFRPWPGSPTLLFDASPYLVLGGPAGTISLTVPSAVTEAFTWYTGVYDLFLYAPAPTYAATALLAGQATVTQSVST
jgi:hypothetical protein